MSGAASKDTIVSGRSLTLRWAKDSRGRYPARSFFEGLSGADQRKVMALFKRLADAGQISNRQHFKKLGHKAKGRGRDFYEFKRFKIRFLGAYHSGAFLVCHGLIKKSDNLKPAEIEKAVRILEEHENQQERANESQRLRTDGAVLRGGSETPPAGRADHRGH